MYRRFGIAFLSPPLSPPGYAQTRKGSHRKLPIRLGLPFNPLYSVSVPSLHPLLPNRINCHTAQKVDSELNVALPHFGSQKNTGSCQANPIESQ